MSKRNKLEKFSDLLTFSNVYEYSDNGYKEGWAFDGEKDLVIRGNWNEHHFKNENPIILELACGRGEYTCALAKLYNDKNFIGLDVKGARIWKGAKYALENLPNAAFLRIRIEHIAYFFQPEEVDEIWITFPDPFLKDTKANRRLTSPQFVERYSHVLKKSGIIHLKTDDTQLYEYTLSVIGDLPNLELIYENDDIYRDKLYSDELAFKTYYEIKHLANSKKIKYIKFRMT